MFQTINIYDNHTLYFDRNGLRRNSNMLLHDPIMVFLAEYNLLGISSADNISIGRYDGKLQCVMPIHELKNIRDKITHNIPLIGKDVQFHNGRLHIFPTIIFGKMLKSKITIPYSRFIGEMPTRPTPVMCWLYNHRTRTLSAILTSSKNP